MLTLIGSALAADLLLRGGKVWNGGDTAEPADVRIVGHAITEVGPNLTVNASTTVLDASGGTVLPGLIDAHVHLSMDPGAEWRKDSDATHLANLRQAMGAYLAYGVTTLLDPAVLPTEEAKIRALLAEGTPGPRYLSLGEPASPPNGYVAAVVPGFSSVDSPESVQLLLNARVSAGAAGVKVTVERGFLAPRFPLHSAEVFAALRTGAAKRNLPIYAHAISPEEQTLALDALDPHAMVHSLDRPHRAVIRRLRESGTYVTSTLAIADSFEIADALERLDDPLLNARVPAAQLETARDPQVAQQFKQRLLAEIAPGAPSWLASKFFARALASQRRGPAFAAIRALHAAGVPLVMGSDAGNWPLIPYLFHGPSSLRELELLRAAGLSPAQALTAATATAAAMLGRPDLGRVAPGATADLVVVNGDPLTGLDAMRDVRLTVRAGDARTPAAWLEAWGGRQTAGVPEPTPQAQ